MIATKTRTSDKAADSTRRIEQLELRNKRVEADKAWETSWIRRLSVAGLTYIVVAVYLAVVIHIDPWINALVPVIGFLLSTLTLSAIKRAWVARRDQS